MFTLKKKWFIITLVGLFLIALTGSVFAWSGKADVGGKPDEFSPNGQKGYYIWQDKNGFHIWTTTPGEEHVFSGVIRTDGTLFNIKGHNLERGDYLRKDSDIQGKSWFDGRRDRNGGNHVVFGGRELNYENNQIRFKFETTGGSDGLNFRITDANYIDFDLYIDGHPISRKDIQIGENSWHPQSHRFRLSQ
ncbi:MAG: hypothetical protein H6Q68_790 [Firmicutes bacterium]|nr:hypothetical protein [Bacillota bacterium]